MRHGRIAPRYWYSKRRKAYKPLWPVAGGAVSVTINAAAQTFNIPLKAAGAGGLDVAALTLNLLGTWVGTVVFEGSNDNFATPGVPLPATPIGGGAPVTSATANGQWTVDTRGWNLARLRSPSWTSGSATAEYEYGEVVVPGVILVRMMDGVTGVLGTVAAFHSADNQQPGGAAFGILTGGVAQLLNVIGNLDRQRETGQDGVPAVGIASGAASFAMAFQTTTATAVSSPGSASITPAAMSGSNAGVPWSIQVGSVLVVDAGAQQEAVWVTQVTATTFGAVFAKTHSGTWTIRGFVYNQERDASGEADGATGAGTAVAAEYEYLSGGPASGFNYDRARNVQGKGMATGTISSGGGIGSTSITMVAAPAGLQPGSPLLLTGGVAEVVYVATSYVPGANPVPIQTAILNAAHTGASWDAYAAQGPGTAGFLSTGVGIEEEALWDPVSGLFYLERAATQDGVPAQNVVMENSALWNGTTMDRLQANVAFPLLSSGARTAGGTVAPSGAFAFNPNGHGLTLFVNVTAVSGTTPTLLFAIQGIDPTTGLAMTLHAALANITVAGTYVIQFGPGVFQSIAGYPAVIGGILPRNWQLAWTIGGTTPSFTFSVGAQINE